MINRKMTGQPPKIALPDGAVDTQMHAYLPQFPFDGRGMGIPLDPLPTPQMYQDVMEWLGIAKVVVTQGNAHGFDNSNLLACIAEFGPMARGVGVITGETPDAEIERLSRGGIVGARIMDLNGGAVGLSQLEAVDARAAAAGWMMAVQFDGSALPELEPRLAKLKSRWVLDHHGKIFAGATQAHVDVIKRLLDGGNVWFKFAGCYESSREGAPLYGDIASVAREIAAHAPERIIWGTNWPHNGARTEADYPDEADLADTTLGWIESEAARKLALVDNPNALFKL